MLRSLFSGVSGLRMHQTKMDVIGNNIANVNTVAFKGSRVTFSDIFSQTLQSASASLENVGGVRGGTNPYQIGLGVTMASIDVLHINGGAQRTDKATDLAIEGSGFFTVTDGINRFYTRAGNFDLDSSGNLVTSSGLQVTGWSYDPNLDAVAITGEPSPINLSNLVLPPKSTENIVFEGNLDNRFGINDTYEYLVSIYDAKGTEHDLTYTFTKTAENIWSYTVTAKSPLTIVNGASGTLVFNTDGRLNVQNSSFPSTTINIPGTDPITYTPAFSEQKFTQFASESSVEAASIDGYKAGVLNGISIDSYGNIIGSYSNGYYRIEGTLAIAQFTNPSGLEKLGDNLFAETVNSGRAELGLPGQDGRGKLNPGALEMSNIDLAKEFTDMISTQRGFQANSRVITTSDEILQELVNLKR